MAPPVDEPAPSALSADDVVGTGGVCGFHGLINTERVVEGEAEAGCSNPVAVAADAVEDEAPTETKKKRQQVALAPYEMEWILAREPCPASPPADREALLEVYPPEMVDGVVETRRVVGQAMTFMNRMLRDLQDSVRKDLAETGVVMVDDDLSSSTDDEEEEEEVAPES